MNNFLIRTLSGAVFAAVIIAMTIWNQYSLMALVIAIGTGALVEYGKLTSNPTARQNLRIILLFVLMFLAFSGFLDIFLAAICLLAFVLLAFITIIQTLHQKTTETISVLSIQLWGIVYIAVPMVLFYKYSVADPYDFRRPLIVFLMVWSSDTFAYLTGKVIGRTPLFPELSPKKTVEGFAGGTFFTAVVGAWLCHQWQISSWFSGAILGALVSLTGTYGDLFESGLKRKAGVKDSGRIIPGHGGFLDRFDAFIFAAVLVYFWDLLVNQVL